MGPPCLEATSPAPEDFPMALHTCPDNCGYKTPHSHLMTRHQTATKHGQARRNVQYTTLGNGMTAKVKNKKGPQNKKAPKIKA
jgi:hypothetical protein